MRLATLDANQEPPCSRNLAAFAAHGRSEPSRPRLSPRRSGNAVALAAGFSGLARLDSLCLPQALAADVPGRSRARPGRRRLTIDGCGRAEGAEGGLRQRHPPSGCRRRHPLGPDGPHRPHLSRMGRPLEPAGRRALDPDRRRRSRRGLRARIEPGLVIGRFGTSISSSLVFSARLVRRQRLCRRPPRHRRVRRRPQQYRAAGRRRRATASSRKGITINGLPIMLSRAIDPYGIGDLDAYYRDCVVGGAGAFTLAVTAADQFEGAIRRKLIQEIAGSGPASLAHRSSSPPGEDESRPERSGTDCLIGEKRRATRAAPHPLRALAAARAPRRRACIAAANPVCTRLRFGRRLNGRPRSRQGLRPVVPCLRPLGHSSAACQGSRGASRRAATN